MFRGIGNLLKRIVLVAAHRANAVFGVMLAIMVLLVVVDVTLRRCFNSPLVFSLEAVQIALVLVVWGAVLYSTALEKHISIDLLVRKLPPRAKKVTATCIDCIGVAIFGILSWQCVTMSMMDYKIHHVSPILAIPYYPLVLFIALAAALAFIVLLLRLVNDLRGIEPDA
jgi:TRAP-type C4-dicarboxylate transport system permease small subunit